MRMFRVYDRIGIAEEFEWLFQRLSLTHRHAFKPNTYYIITQTNFSANMTCSSNYIKLGTLKI